MDRIEDIVNELGIHATYRGYHYLCYALTLCQKDENYILYVWKYLYTDVGKKFGKQRSSIERAIRTVISVCWYDGNRELLNEIAGYTLTEKPSAGDFIAMISYYLKKEERLKNS